jgi:hypothetical protein
LLPRARRRHADEVDARREPAVFPDEPDELVPFARAVRKGRAQLPVSGGAVAAGDVRANAAQPRFVGLVNRAAPRPEVAPRDDMDRPAQHGGLHQSFALQCPRERIPLESFDARPEPDVRRRRVLRLDPAHLLDRARQRSAPSLEQLLPRE